MSHAKDMRTIHDREAGSAGDTARERLSQRLDELEMVLGAARVGYCRLAADGRVLAASTQFRCEFGLPPDGEAVWTEFESRMQVEDRAELTGAIARAFESETGLDALVRTTWGDGLPRWIVLNGRIVRDTNSEPHLLLVSREATREQLTVAALAGDAQRERRARETAERANRAKDEFLSLVSHELRSPLNAILGWNRILAVKRGDDPEVASVAPRIERSAKAQLKLVNDLLDLGRLGTGKLRITPRTMKLSAVAGAAVDQIRPAASAKLIDVRTQFSSVSSEVHGDPDRLQQVVSNLLSNALKFTPGGGRIDVSVGAVDDIVELNVMDTGQGIAPELLPYVFDRFRQGDETPTTQRAGGLGLGLTLVREIVALHGGTVSASSEGPGKGAAFRVRLPGAAFVHAAAEAAATAEINGEAPANGASRALEGLSILVVDDEADARTVVAETLRLEGARVTVSDSAGSALDQLSAPGARYDVIVTDIGMPEEDGYSLVRKLRALTNGDRMVAIAVTGFASRTDVEAAIDAGFDLHVPKPVDFESFVPIIRRLSSAR
jgi:signal transduction histidine kinase/ActR/RegA family two-component response regulator